MRLSDVRFSYPGRTVLDGFSLDIPGAGVTALSGPSGCGKTTLLRLIAGLERPGSGAVEAPGLRDTAFLFQEDRLLPGLTASGQLRAVLPRGTDVGVYLDAVGLAGEYGSPIASLSGGMRRRVALARALAYGEGKALVILDEPFTGVDAPTARGIMDSFRALGCPVLLSAHDAESLALADRVIYLSGPPLAEIS